MGPLAEPHSSSRVFPTGGSNRLYESGAPRAHGDTSINLIGRGSPLVDVFKAQPFHLGWSLWPRWAQLPSHTARAGYFRLVAATVFMNQVLHAHTGTPLST